MTDIATDWTECVPIVLRESGLVIEAIAKARSLLPFALRGIDFDNDGTFMNDTVIGWCRDIGLEVTRSRAYRKNDQAWVEQKNGAVVRRLVGYGRFEGIAAAQSLARLYAAARLHINLFQPSFKLKTKTRIGARVIKRYHAPVSPLMRLLCHPAIGAAESNQLTALRATCDPVLLLAEIRAAQAELGQRVDRRGLMGGEAAPIVIDLDRFRTGLKAAWREGEQRPTHRRPYRRSKPLPRRAHMVDDYEAQVRAWLDAEPNLPAQVVLARLIEANPETFSARHLRTIQRAVKAWRGEMARKMILDGFSALTGAQVPG